MIALDAVLPELEKAVDDRVESKALASLEPDELRHLIYKLVERQRVAALDPSRHFAELVDSASERHADMVAARDHSVRIRTELLRQLLVVLRPALPSLLGPITIETVQKPDEHERRLSHPMLRGFEILNGAKQGPVNSETFAKSGRSWWIVGLAPEDPASLVDARYAVAEHFGKVDSDGVGKTWCDVELVDSPTAAAKIRDDHFEKILARLHERLVSLTGKKVARTTDDLWAVANVLDSALAAMKTMAQEVRRR